MEEAVRKLADFVLRKALLLKSAATRIATDLMHLWVQGYRRNPFIRASSTSQVDIGHRQALAQASK
jgi:hypothetical protein